MKTETNTTLTSQELTTLLFQGEEVQTVISSLDFFCRMHLGQFCEIGWYEETIIKSDFTAINACHEEINQYLSQLQALVYPALHGWLNLSYGCYNPLTDERAKISWDIVQTLRRARAYALHPEGGDTVDFSPVLQAGKEKLPERVAADATGETDEERRQHVTLSAQYTKKHQEIMRMAVEMYRKLWYSDIAGIMAALSKKPDVKVYAEKLAHLLAQFANIPDAVNEIHYCDQVLGQLAQK